MYISFRFITVQEHLRQVPAINVTKLMVDKTNDRSLWGQIPGHIDADFVAMALGVQALGHHLTMDLNFNKTVVVVSRISPWLNYYVLFGNSLGILPSQSYTDQT